MSTVIACTICDECVDDIPQATDPQCFNTTISAVAFSTRLRVYILSHFLVNIFAFRFYAAPEISEALTVSDITQTSIDLSWSIGNTQHIDRIQLYQRQMGSSWSATTISSNSSHTVMSLTPGTTYQFYVEVQSYAITARTNIITVPTGATLLAG